MSERVVEMLVRQWEYDIAVFSQPWMYWWLCVPALAYLCFYFVKWMVLTAPLWLPFAMVVKAFRAPAKGGGDE